MAEFIKDNRLVKAMREMKANSDNKYKNFFVAELTRTEFIVPVNISPEPENGKIKKGSVISYMALRDSNDRKMMLCYTSKGEHDKFATGANFLIKQTYSQICSVVKAKQFDGFIIDPAGENVAVSNQIMEAISESVPLQVSNEKVQMEGDHAALEPAGSVALDELKAALKEYLESKSEINKCWLMQTMRENEKTPTLVVVLDFEGEIGSVFNGIAVLLKKYMRTGETLGFMSVKDNVAADAVSDVEPFFARS